MSNLEAVQEYWVLTIQARDILINTINEETGERESHAPVLGGIMHGTNAVIRDNHRPSSLYDYSFRGTTHSVWDLYRIKEFSIGEDEVIKAYVCVKRRLHTTLEERLFSPELQDDGDDYYTQHEENTLLISFCVDFLAEYERDM